MIFQLGSALLDACVLAVLSEEDAYGYSLTQREECAMIFRIHPLPGAQASAKGKAPGHLR